MWVTFSEGYHFFSTGDFFCNIFLLFAQVQFFAHQCRYKYCSPKLKVKNEIQQRNLRLNWCEKHIIGACFPDLYLSDEPIFYLDNPVDARWVKSKENYIQ